MEFSVRTPLLVLLLLAVGLSGACAAPSQTTHTGASADNEPAVVDVPVYASWDEVTAAAQGTTVNWFLWGGSETINSHVDGVIGEALQEEFGITVNRVPLDNTADAVNKVLNEKAAGRDSGGSIDLIWINGENFRTLKDADLLYGPFVDLVPNSLLVDWENPAVAYDFGVAVDGYESPWPASSGCSSITVRPWARIRQRRSKISRHGLKPIPAALPTRRCPTTSGSLCAPALLLGRR